MDSVLVLTAPPAAPSDLRALARGFGLACSDHLLFGLAAPLWFTYTQHPRAAPSFSIAGLSPNLAANLSGLLATSSSPALSSLLRLALFNNARAMVVDRAPYEAILGMELFAQDLSAWDAAPLSESLIAAGRAAAGTIRSTLGGGLGRALYSTFLQEALDLFYTPPLSPSASGLPLVEDALSLAAEWDDLAAFLIQCPAPALFSGAARRVRRLAAREEFFWGRILDLCRQYPNA